MEKAKSISLILGVLIMSIFIVYLSFAWQSPTKNPPQGNVSAPLNVSSNNQTKTGNLTLPNLYLNATANEGNIYAIDQLIGYNDLRLKGKSDETAPIYYGASEHRFFTAKIERLTILNNGNVGIGTTAPGYKLDVSGDIRSTGYVRGGTGLCIGSDCRTSWPTGGGETYWVLSGSNLYTSSTAWNVGIGTRAPAYRLHVVGGDVKIGNYAGDNRKLYFGDGSYVWIGEDADDKLEIYAERRTAIMGGNVGIGTTAPGQKLEVSGNIKATQVMAGSGSFGFTASGDNWTGFDLRGNNKRIILGVTGGQTRNVFDIERTDTWEHLMELRADGSAYFKGNVGIGTTAPAYKLHIQGGDIYSSGYVRGGTGLCIGSDCKTSWPTPTGSAFQGMISWKSPGRYTWQVPAGVTKIMIEVWGGGGGGGAGTDPSYAKFKGGNGGGGGYGKGIYNVTPGATLTIVVGAGGSGGIYGYDSRYKDGKPGETSYVSDGRTTLISATGGGGGQGGEKGSYRYYSPLACGGGGTSNAPFSAVGENCGMAALGVGWPGSPGQGIGGGGLGGAPANNGADGAPGAVIIYW